MHKRIDFTQLNGFPLTQNTLAFMQESYREIFAALSGYYGQYTIVAGVADLGANWGDGLVTYNGELLPFVGGLKNSQIIIEQTQVAKQFNDGQNRNVWFTRVARCGVAGGIPFTSFVRLPSASQLITDIAARVAKSGDSMTGPLSIPAGTLAAHAVNKGQLDAAISQLINGSPAALDTLIELANALGNDANFATTVTNALAARVLKAGDTMTGNLVISGVNSGFNSGNVLTKTFRIPITNWNMLAANFIDVAHGVADFKRIHVRSIVIRNDSDSVYIQRAFQADNATQVDVSFPNANDFRFSIAPGFYNNADYDQLGGYVRGWVLFDYIL